MFSRTAIQGYLQDDLPSFYGSLTSDCDISTARALALKSSLLKKFTDGIDQKSCDSKALEKFLKCNDYCRSFSLQPQSLFDDEIIGEVKSLLHDVVGNGPDHTLGLFDFSDDLGVGPGANVGAQSYNFYTKVYDSELTMTEDHLLRLYRSAISRNPVKYSAERQRYNTHGTRVVAGSLLSFVPKTSEISRTICTEPTLNMMFQQGIGRWLERKLKVRYNIDLSVQPDVNRRMAKLGSISGQFGTIDLESASDSISMSLCEQVLPRILFSWLKLTRSPFATLPSGEKVKLEMVSSMGNAFTFPLQTLLFSAIVHACYRLKGLTLFDGRTKDERNFSVFGDDIIVREDCYALVVRTLELFGFRVNKEKSFNSGHFRESCGEDYYRGHNIRGVYLQSLQTPSDVYSAINRLVRWSARSGLYLSKLIGALRRKVKYLPIPLCDGDAEGLKVPYCAVVGKLRKDKHLQSDVYYALQALPRSISLPQPINDSHAVELEHRLYYEDKVIKRARWYAVKDHLDYNPDGP